MINAILVGGPMSGKFIALKDGTRSFSVPLAPGDIMDGQFSVTSAVYNAFTLPNGREFPWLFVLQGLNPYQVLEWFIDNYEKDAREKAAKCAPQNSTSSATK